MTKFGRDGLVARLQQPDDDLASLYPGERFDLVVVDGSALALRELASGKVLTADIDVLEADPAIEALLDAYDINTHVDTYRFKFPAGYADRLVEVGLGTTSLRVLTLSNEDLAITKLLAWRPQDRDDVRGMLERGNIDLELLDGILSDVGEVRANLDETEWQGLLSRAAELGGWNLR